MNVREPVFAKQGWYPYRAEECNSILDAYFQSFSGNSGFFGGVVPHAGWVFSGKLAAWTFEALRSTNPEVVFLFGGHLGPDAVPVCMTHGAWGTPLGQVEVHEELAQQVAERFNCLRESPESFEPDNTIELQMPILKKVWPEAKVVALQVPPRADTMAIGQWAAETANRNAIAAVGIGSTDLTHYGSQYGFEPKGRGFEAHQWSKEINDRGFIHRLMQFEVDEAVHHALTNRSACCPGAAGAAALFARQMGAEKAQLVEHLTSYEIEGTGEPSMWVGYASVVF